MKKWIFPFILSLMVSVTAHAVIEVHEFDTPEQELQFQELNHTLRCPKCQNNTIGDSNAELALDLREKVYEMTKDGKSKQEIVDYMVARYGNFVTYKPPFTIATAVLWLGPLLVVVIGFGFILTRSRKRPVKTVQSATLSEEEQQRLNALLKDDNGDNK
ncbi:cystathionine gamma-synthase [Vibrio sp. UCD-FRSSP16_10]|uniref:cytochrome c-type biogenesis protein n=1 Tax=unclassified Vibrio TaxID=2614977 RepID=UPI0007FBF7AA|nr:MULTISPECIES: cytochrome c-type biogenesis protein [unclassified Vibrio]OBT15863.1 cystathionine gamma-synthase [Vibrio sp. UCD-FRSSP16_10]OBT17757.1 cystathionine gamma-synthase [Vibrio sp. UCD-FRSSP16_30]